MSKQETFFDQTEADIGEAEAFALILPSLLEVTTQENIPKEFLSLACKKNFSSIMLSTYLVVRLHFRGSHSCIEIPSACERLICAPLHAEKGAKGFVSVPIVPASSIESYGAFFQQILLYAIDRIPKKFDCCSQVEACSDAKRCNTPLQKMAIACGYKRVLRSGQCFYGKNQNVELRPEISRPQRD